MISNRPLRIGRFATAMWLVMLVAVPAARAQRQKRPSPAAGTPASKTATLKYVCFSTDPKQPNVYLSGIFDLPDNGDETGNFMQHVIAREAFQLYLIDKYNYSDDDFGKTDLADCSYISAATTANAAAAAATKKHKVEAEAIASKKRVVETGWTTTEANIEGPDTTAGQESGRQVAQQDNPSRAANKTDGPLFQWHMDKKTDALSGDVSTQPGAMKVIAGANGKPQGYVSVHAYCSRNGVSIFFQADPGDKAPPPSFPWYDDTSRGDDGGQITDVRLRVDDRPVHVAQGFPEVDGHQVYANTLGLLFYEPHTEARAVRDQQNRMATGVPALDGVLGGIVNQAARSNAETWQSNAAGPLSDLVNARSIRLELPVTTFNPKPLVDLNPQDPVLHKFVSECNAKFTR